MTFQELLTKIKIFEGFSKTVYIDAGGTPTIGYGRTLILSINEVTTKEKEDKWLEDKVNSIYEKVKNTMLKYHYNSITYNQLLALTDFTYNLGIGNLLKLIDYGKRDIPTIADKILLYNKCNRIKLEGLTKRRQWEHDLFVQDIPKLEKKNNTTILQELINSYYSKNNINKQIKVDGIIGNETISACIDVFNLL